MRKFLILSIWCCFFHYKQSNWCYAKSLQSAFTQILVLPTFLGTGFCISGVRSQARKHDIAGFHHLPTQSSSKIWLKVHTGWIKVWGTVSCEWLLTVSKLPLCMSSMGGRKRSARVLSFLSTVPPLRSSCSWRTRNRKTFIHSLLEVKMPQQKYETDF